MEHDRNLGVYQWSAWLLGCLQVGIRVGGVGFRAGLQISVSYVWLVGVHHVCVLATLIIDGLCGFATVRPL